MSFLKEFLTEHWQRKLVAIIAALIIWFIVSNSITVTRTVTNIPVRVVNLPPNKTIETMLPNGFLKKKVSLNLHGNREQIHKINPSDLQVVLDAQNKGDQWIAKIDKQSLYTSNPDLDINQSISDVSGYEFVIRLTPLVTEKVPIYIRKPVGNPPPGYQFLDIWPQTLTQTVSGPEDQVLSLQSKGLELIFDLNNISASDLDNLQDAYSKKTDEVSFFVPDNWKYVNNPFQDNNLQKINDPAAEPLRIDFLRSMLLPLDVSIPLALFFPLDTSVQANPKKDILEQNPLVEEVNGIPILKMQLFAKDVSQLFLDIVRSHLEIVIIADPNLNGAPLKWAIQYINPKDLEDTYIQESIKENAAFEKNPELEEELLRKRFRNYLRKLEFVNTNGKKLRLDIHWDKNKIVIHDGS